MLTSKEIPTGKSKRALELLPLRVLVAPRQRVSIEDDRSVRRHNKNLEARNGGIRTVRLIKSKVFRVL